jgi:hypothetical protein
MELQTRTDKFGGSLPYADEVKKGDAHGFVIRKKFP